MQLRKYYILALGMMIVIVVSQVYWLLHLFRTHQIEVKKELSKVVKIYFLEQMSNSLTEAGNISVGKKEIKGTPDEVNLLKGILDKVAELSKVSETEVTIKVLDTASGERLRNKVKHNAIISPDQMQKKLAESLNTLFKAEGIHEPYKVLYSNSFQDTINVMKAASDPSGKRPFIIRSGWQAAPFPEGGAFSVEYTKPFALLISRMKWELIFSFGLIVLSAFVFVFFIRTIAKQKRLHELKNDFVSNMTHELKTPLAICSAALESMERFDVMKDTEKTTRYIGIMKYGIERIRLLTDKVLATSQSGNGKAVYYPEQVNITDAIRRQLDVFGVTIAEKGISVDLKFPGQPVYIRADVLHITNVLSNVIDNAIKYNLEQQGKITIDVKTENAMVYIRIRNTGKGFPKAYEEQVFERFFRVPSSNVHDVKGYGLGLNYSKHVVTAHDGQISITSNEQFTELTICLPVYENNVA